MIKKTDTAGEVRPRIKPPEIRRRPSGSPAGSPTQTPLPPAAPRPSGAPSRERRSGGRRNRAMGPRPGATPVHQSRKFSHQPTPLGERDKANADAVRFVPLGGLEEVGRNCMFLEYKDEIVLI